MGRISHDDQEAYSKLHDCFLLIGCVSNAFVVSEGYPSPPGDFLEPLNVRGVVKKVISMSLNGQSGLFQNVREDVSEIAIGEENDAQAARSKITASSIVATVT